MTTKVEIELPRPDADGHPVSGFGTRVLVNGVEVNGIRFVDLKIHPSEHHTVILEIVPDQLIVRYAYDP